MKVTLINWTPNALALLLFTKQTRLVMDARGIDTIAEWPEERKLQELEYMRNTIQSSWEFVDYVFVIEDVTRAFTHQLVRHRVGVSFAQQAQRAVDMTGFGYETGPSIETDPNLNWAYQEEMRAIDQAYQFLVTHGANPQDARGLLPTNIHTNIIMKINLRALHEMLLKRLCVKAQGEFQDVARLLREQVITVHPWAGDFLRVWCATHGTCLFPTFPVAECPAKPLVYDPVTQEAYGGGKPGSLYQIESCWAAERAEAQPLAPGRGEG